MEWIKAKEETAPIGKDGISEIIFIKQKVDNEFHKNTGVFIPDKEGKSELWYNDEHGYLVRCAITDETYWLKEL